MHILTVIDHPNPNSFTAAVAARFNNGAEAAGHTTEIADLHSEGFDPRWSMADIEGESSSKAPPYIVSEQQRIARADAICLAFPLFWWGMPSMMKGWVDRVWTWGWAYDQLGNPKKSLQKARTGVLLVPAGARSDEMEMAGYLQALETAWTRGTFGYFGFSPRKIELLHGSNGSIKRRQALLERSYDIGFTLPSPRG
ncbi:NAD(P)H dehydrogenase (quinone) [Ruegeria halocynthiae]|uniref:NAD(P)H dehydrogenase (Quinone) n=1 Tax=Ruegeria halocynthiae TaxID=985054 RepID=A0A1H2SHU4_9RHOB|nr:NAD(P)H-dependent oxidoreductase [Ruegeria halocynthiae]SDW31171.1 NAD(P)H dehydrogenase (quinone) [Ruegeria halocynthiae]